MKEAKWKQIGLYCCFTVQVILYIWYYTSSFDQFYSSNGVLAWVLSALIGIIFAIINLVSVQSRFNFIFAFAALILSAFQLVTMTS